MKAMTILAVFATLLVTSCAEQVCAVCYDEQDNLVGIECHESRAKARKAVEPLKESLTFVINGVEFRPKCKVEK